MVSCSLEGNRELYYKKGLARSLLFLDRMRKEGADKANSMLDQRNILNPNSNEEPETILEGQVERITYANEETGYTVAKLALSGVRESITIVGNLIAPVPGEMLKVKGAWLTHPRFGKQFKVVSHQSIVPATVIGIKKYLGSGLIKGIGPVMASRIVKQFGEKTLEIIDRNPHELHQVEGIGRKRIEMIAAAWREQKEIRDVMVFLQGHSVSPAYATKIFKKYGWDSIKIVSQNPYRLATDILGIGFLTADKIAGSMGFEKNAPARVEAGILYVLHQLSEEGHVYFPYEPLVDRCREILEVDRELISKAIGAITLENKIVIEDLNQDLEAFQTNHKAVYLKSFHIAETGIADHLLRLTASPKKMRNVEVGKALKWVQEKIRLEFAAKADRGDSIGGVGKGDGDHRRPRHRKDHHHQCGHQDLPGTRRQDPARRSDRQGIQADERGDRIPCENHSPHARIQPAKRRIPARPGPSS